EGLHAASQDDVTSPTLTLIHEYRGPEVNQFHVDLYRIDTPRELDTLGLDELFAEPATWCWPIPPLPPPRAQLSRFGVPRMWFLGGSITLSNRWVNIAAAKKATARSVSLPVLARSCRTPVGRTKTFTG